MFRPMRRGAQALSREQTEAILRRGSAGTLAVSGDEGYPYAVPLSYVYHEGRIWLHCAREGHKLDAIRRCGKVSFCVIDRDEVAPEALTTHYRSAIAFGRARELTDADEMYAAMHVLAKKYAPGLSDARIRDATRSEFDGLCVLVIDIEHLSGKEAVELVKARQSGDGAK